MKNFAKGISKLMAMSVCSVILFSCSKHTVTYGETAAIPARQVINEIQVVNSSLPSTAVSIDTLIYPRKSSAVFSEAYYTERVGEKTSLFYRENKFETKWLFNSQPANLYYEMINNLSNAGHFGLLAEDYDVDNIQEAVNKLYEKQPVSLYEVMALDIHITDMFFLFTTQLVEGKIRNSGSQNIWLREQPRVSNTQDVALLLKADNSTHIRNVFTMLHPSGDQFIKLQKALEHYHDLDRYAVEKLPRINPAIKVEPEKRNPVIPIIRKRLSQFDLKVYPLVIDTLTGTWDSLLYDKSLVQGIAAFQIMHGLEPDGIIGARTVNFLNQLFSEKANVIALNMERLRWNTETSQGEYIIVNVPDYKLRIFDNQKKVFEMRVIVGAVDNATPIFNDEIEHIVFSPTWTVPTSIIKEEIIPHLKSNPAYYSKKNYEFYRNGMAIDPVTEAWTDESNPYQYKVVQQPGPDNSLGLVKFGMTNSMRIYLHDTPGQRLFSKEYRALSHGCVRLDEPARFAEYLLRDQKGWDKDKIQNAMNGGKTSTILLKKHYPVRIEYCTAWVDEQGQVNFREDIYGHDRIQLQQLLKPVDKVSPVIAGL